MLTCLHMRFTVAIVPFPCRQAALAEKWSWDAPRLPVLATGCRRVIIPFLSSLPFFPPLFLSFPTLLFTVSYFDCQLEQLFNFTRRLLPLQ